MSCKDYYVMINTFLDGEINDEDKLKLMSHLEVCPNCRRDLEDLKAINSIGKKVWDNPPQSDFSKNKLDIMVAIGVAHPHKAPQKSMYEELMKYLKRYPLRLALVPVATLFIIFFLIRGREDILTKPASSNKQLMQTEERVIKEGEKPAPSGAVPESKPTPAQEVSKGAKISPEKAAPSPEPTVSNTPRDRFIDQQHQTRSEAPSIINILPQRDLEQVTTSKPKTVSSLSKEMPSTAPSGLDKGPRQNFKGSTSDKEASDKLAISQKAEEKSDDNGNIDMKRRFSDKPAAKTYAPSEEERDEGKGGRTIVDSGKNAETTKAPSGALREKSAGLSDNYIRLPLSSLTRLNKAEKKKAKDTTSFYSSDQSEALKPFVADLYISSKGYVVRVVTITSTGDKSLDDIWVKYLFSFSFRPEKSDGQPTGVVTRFNSAEE